MNSPIAVLLRLEAKEPGPIGPNEEGWRCALTGNTRVVNGQVEYEFAHGLSPYPAWTEAWRIILRPGDTLPEHNAPSP